MEVTLKTAKVKHHGCVCPFNIMQILSYVVFAFLVYSYYFINAILFSYSIVLLCLLTIPYSINLILIVIAALLATISDPTDPTVYKEKGKHITS